MYVALLTNNYLSSYIFFTLWFFCSFYFCPPFIFIRAVWLDGSVIRMKVLVASKGASKPLRSLEKQIALICLSHTQHFHVHWHVQSGKWSGFHGNYGNWTSNSVLWSLISCHLQMPLPKEVKQYCPFLLSLSLFCFSAPPSPFKSLKYVHVWGDFLPEENQKKTFGDFKKDWVMAVVLLTKLGGDSIQPSASVARRRQFQMPSLYNGSFFVQSMKIDCSCLKPA